MAGLVVCEEGRSSGPSWETWMARDGWEGRLGCSGRPRQWDSGRWRPPRRGAPGRKQTDLDSGQYEVPVEQKRTVVNERGEDGEMQLQRIERGWRLMEDTMKEVAKMQKMHNGRNVLMRGCDGCDLI